MTTSVLAAPKGSAPAAGAHAWWTRCCWRRRRSWARRLCGASHRGRGRAGGRQQDDHLPALADEAGAGERCAPPPRGSGGAARDRLAARGSLAALRHTLSLWSSPIGKGLVRMIQSERAHPEVEAISRERRKEYGLHRAALVERAIQRGELPPGTDADLLVDLTFSSVMARMLRREVVDEAYLTAIVDFVVEGGAPDTWSRAKRGPERGFRRRSAAGVSPWTRQAPGPVVRRPRCGRCNHRASCPIFEERSERSEPQDSPPRGPLLL